MEDASGVEYESGDDEIEGHWNSYVVRRSSFVVRRSRTHTQIIYTGTRSDSRDVTSKDYECMSCDETCDENEVDEMNETKNVTSTDEEMKDKTPHDGDNENHLQSNEPYVSNMKSKTFLSQKPHIIVNTIEQ